MFKVFGLLSGLIVIIAYFPYIRDILQKKTNPQRASWLIWAVLGLISFFSQMAKGATNSLWLPGMGTLGVLLVFVLSIKYGMGGLAKRDLIFLLFAAIGVVLWFLTKEPLTALVITIFVDFLGSWLTLAKTYKRPETETLIGWVLFSASGFVSILSVGNTNLVLLIYPLYIGIINAAISLAIIFGRQKKK